MSAVKESQIKRRFPESDVAADTFLNRKLNRYHRLTALVYLYRIPLGWVEVALPTLPTHL